MMALIGMRYMNAVTDGGTGRIEIEPDQIRVRLTCSRINCELEIIRLSGTEKTCCVGNCRTDENGRADVSIRGIHTCEDDAFMICTKENMILFDRTLEEDKAVRAFKKIKFEKEAQNERQPQPIKETDAQPTVEEGTQDEYAVYKRESAEIAADMLPALLWPAEWNTWKAYFDSVPQKTDGLSDSVNWKFVSVPALLNDRTIDCILGRYVQKDCVNALCVIVDERHGPPQSYLPGFQYKKSPDGRGWWFRLERAHKNA